jgi:hypothetical protein
MSTKFFTTFKFIALGGLLAIQVIALSGIGQTRAFAATPSQRQDDPQKTVPDDPEYIEAIQRTTSLTNNPQAIELAAGYGLNVVNVMWEDTDAIGFVG